MSEHAGLTADVTISLGARTINVSLEAEPGEVIAIVGPNGAGKTTLLRSLAGLHAIDEGRIALDGRILDDRSSSIHVAPEHRSIGVVFQDHLLFGRMSVLDNVAFPIRANGATRADARAGAGELLDRLGLSAFAARRPHGLSGGEARQVSIARALANRPAMLLLDEPLASLDPATGDARRSDLRAFIALMRGPTLLVTHDLIDVASLTTRVLVLEEGRVTSDASTAMTLARPTTDYAARFCGVSLLRGIAAHGILQTANGGHVPIDDHSRSGPSIAVVRPSSLRVLPLGQATRSDSWTGSVRSLEHRGSTVMVQVSGPPDVAVEVAMADFAAFCPSLGDVVTIEVTGAGLSAYDDPSAA